MIRYESIATQVLHSEPYTWGVVQDVIPPSIHAQLADEFPDRGYKHLRRQAGSDKRYEAWFRSVRETSHSAADVQGMTPLWMQLIADISSEPYRAAVSQASGLDLTDHRLEISLWRYSGSHFLSPHTDIHSKRVTHLIYFNDGWDRTWGGCLRILNSTDVNDVAEEIPPSFAESVLLVRSDRSWHAVSQVAVDRNEVRRVLQISFWSEVPVQGAAIPGLEVIASR